MHKLAFSSGKTADVKKRIIPTVSRILCHQRDGTAEGRTQPAQHRMGLLTTCWKSSSASADDLLMCLEIDEPRVLETETAMTALRAHKFSVADRILTRDINNHTSTFLNMPVELHLLRAVARVGMKRYAMALQDVDVCIYKQPGVPQAHTCRARILSMMGSPPNSLSGGT
jgi:hypothetical protein